MLIAGSCQISQNSLRIAIVIPARLDSKRFPRKALLDIHGLPMVEHVRRRGLMNSHGIPVFVVSGDDEILSVTESFGGLTLKTYQDHLNGLSRIFEASKAIDFTHYIVLQGDEVLIPPSQLDEIIHSIQGTPEVDFWNSISPLQSENEIHDFSVVKCLLNSADEIFTIFRGVPLTASVEMQMSMIYKICGLFSVSSQALHNICTSPATKIELAESIEQIKYLELGKSIRAVKTEGSFTSINLPSDHNSVMETFANSEFQNRLLERVLANDV